jgi:hypothetical protein
MADKDMKKTMLREWENARKSFYYPQLPKPRFSDKPGREQIDMDNLEVVVSEPYVQKLAEKNITPEQSMNELFTRQLAHFMKFPGSFLNVLRMHHAARQHVDAKTAKEMRLAFNEAQADAYMVKEVEHPATIPIKQNTSYEESGKYGKLLYGLCGEQAGKDIGVKLEDNEKGLVQKLKKLNYLDERKQLQEFGKFVDIMREYNQNNNSQQEQSGSSGSYCDSGEQGNSEGGSGGKGNEKDNDKDKQKKVPGAGASGQEQMFDENQLLEGLREFAKLCENPNEYEQTVKEVLADMEAEQKKVEREEGFEGGKKAGLDRAEFAIAKDFYTALATKYAIPIRQTQTHRNGSLYPHSHEPFVVGDSLHDLDPFSTPGILPGITKKWLRKEGEFAGNEGIPNSVILVDNSGSMPDPRTRISVPVLAGTVISNAYLDNGARVAVYSFGGNDRLTPLTRDKKDVHEGIRRYTGGGTTFNSSFLKKALGNSEEPFDVTVISDMEISNFDHFIQTVQGLPKNHRIHLLYVGGDISSLRDKFKKKENIAVMPIHQESDIPKIIMGEIEKSVHYHGI